MSLVTNYVFIDWQRWKSILDCEVRYSKKEEYRFYLYNKKIMTEVIKVMIDDEELLVKPISWTVLLDQLGDVIAASVLGNSY